MRQDIQAAQLGSNDTDLPDKAGTIAWQGSAVLATMESLSDQCRHHHQEPRGHVSDIADGSATSQTTR